MALEHWRRVKPLADPAAVEQLERRYQVRLSHGLRACILANNGGRPVPDGVRLAGGRATDVRLLLSYNPEDRENIYRPMEYFVEKYHGSLIPFAVDSGGNYFCQQGERIVLWRQDGEFCPVSENFEEFLDRLCIPK